MELKKIKSKKQEAARISSTDRATEYALAVSDGKIMAGPIVHGACLRHIDDLKHGAERGLYYDEEEAARAIRFFEDYLFLNSGQYEGKPFILLGWQCFVVGSLFGWKRMKDDMRRFRVAYIETPKGSGKSPLAAGIGLKGLVADKEPRAEIYAAATFQKQAMVLFRDAVAFYDQSPELQKKLKAYGTGSARWNLEYLDKGSFFQVISSDKHGQSGPRPHMALLDEIHEHRDGTVIELVRAGFKFRRQPLSFMITNSGHDKTSVCWEYHEMGRRVALQMVENDEFFAYICSLDEDDLVDDKYLDDETLWPKVNPSLDAGIPGYDYIRGQVREAKGMPQKMATVKRLCFCQWTESNDPWISGVVWLGCRDTDFDGELLLGRRCWGGLDLSATQDLTAYVLMFEPTEADPFWRLKPFFWLPNDNLRLKSDQDHVPYDVWRDAGNLFTTVGSAISKATVLRFIDQTWQKYNIVGIAYDPNKMDTIIEAAKNESIDLSLAKWDKNDRVWKADNYGGIFLMPFNQQAVSMHPALDKFETWLVNDMMRHDGNPVMTWCAANAVVKSDDNNYRKVSKTKSVGRVDGVVAAIMACGVSETYPYGSVYEERGIMTL